MVDSSHQLAERFLLRMAEFGSLVSASLVKATAEPEFVRNAPLVVLCILDLEGPTRPSHLQDAVGLTSGGTSKLLDRLEEAGFIKRAYGVVVADNRGVEVTITAAGRRHLRRSVSALQDSLPEAALMLKELSALVAALSPGAGVDDGGGFSEPTPAGP